MTDTADAATEPSGALAPPPVSYTFQASMLSGQQVFRLEDDGLHWNVARYAGVIPYAAISAIRLSYKPTSLASQRYQLELWADATPKLTIASTSWRNIVEQERHDAAYAAFVRALHRKIAIAGGRPLLHAGAPVIVYWLGAVVFAGFAVLVPVFLLRSALAGAASGAAIVALLMVFFFYRMVQFFRRNRPTSYEIGDVPPRVLPRA